MRLDCAKCGEKVDRGLVSHGKCYKSLLKKIKRLEKQINGKIHKKIQTR